MVLWLLSASVSDMIIAVATSFVPAIGILLGIAGIAFRRLPGEKGARTGIALSIVGSALCVIALGLVVLGRSGFFGFQD